MRKNQFRSILLASLVVTAIGGFNSCKDYDDDIAELRNEIRTQSTDLNSLVADKVHNLEIEATALQQQLSSLESAYKAADAALQVSINNAVADAKNAAASDAASKANAAEKAANSYADIQAAEAQRAAIASATSLVADAQNSLNSAIAAANTTIAEQGKSIASLLQADKELQLGINTATARANEAYSLASQALEKANAALAAAEKAQGTADEAKLQAAQNATQLATIAENLKSVQETLTSQINVFGSQVSAVQALAAENKAKIEAQAAQLADMKAANDKAQAAIDALGTKLNDQVDALKNLITANQAQILVLQGGLDAVKSDVDGLKTQIGSANKAIDELKAAVASLLTADTDLEKKINNAINEITGVIAGLTNRIDANESGITDLRSIITKLQTGEIASLQDAVDILNKQMKGVAKNSDVDALQGQINSLSNDLSLLNDAIEVLTNTAGTAATQADIDAKVGALANTVGANYDDLKGQIEALKGVANAEYIASAAKVAADAAVDKAVGELLTKIEAGEFNQDLSGINTAISTLQDQYAAIDDKIAAEVTAKINELKPALIAELTNSLTATINKGDEALQSEIDILVQILADYMGIDLSDENAEVKLFAAAEAGNSKAAELLEKLQNKVDGVASVSDITNNTLESISLIPQLFIGGIEAIEFTSLKYTPAEPGKSGAPLAGAAAILVDNGETEAYYRLNPATAKLDQVDVDNIKYYAATAETRAVSVASPVEFNGIKSYAGGLLGVYLKKAKGFTGDLNRPDKDNNNIKYIVALSVPRKADAATGVEARQIVSENSLVVETEKEPKIARLPWKTDATLNGNNIHHYSDSTTLYTSKVDANPLEMVYEEVEYNQTYDVLAHVTGCNVKVSHEQISKDKLKKYGLTFRFAIPTKEYKEDADHKTNQQAFAAIDEKTGIVRSKLPNNEFDNRACVGKEPIIRIELVDTVNHKLVDQRYMKIKWKETAKDPVDLGTYTNVEEKNFAKYTLKPCDVNNSVDINWEWFITQVYAKAAVSGLSQSTFDKMYPVTDVTYSDVTINPNYNDRKMVLNDFAPIAKPVVAPTTNVHGDAIIANWTLTPAMIGRIYPSQSKTFKCTIKFVSANNVQYPDLTLTWEWKIDLPTFPEITGYYPNYWFNPNEEHDITPVQFETSRYNQFLTAAGVINEGNLTAYDPADNAVAPGTPYCVFYNDLMNAFQYDPTSGFIVKNMSGCATWDMQFTWTGNDKFKGSYTQYPGYAPLKLHDGTNYVDHISPSLYTEKWDVQRTYVLNKITNDLGTTGIPALQMVWGDGNGNFDHTAWDAAPAYKNATLYADHNNVYNQALLNKLAEEKPDGSGTEADGWTPKRTHTKAINLGVWATLNDWNIIPLKNYKIYLVEPIRITPNLGDKEFEDLIIHGTAISCDDAFKLVDFAGYEVAQTDLASPVHKQAYRTKLWKYYELSAPVWKFDKVRFGFDGNLKERPYDEATFENSIDAATLRAKTNGNAELSISKKTKGGTEYLVFENNGGSPVERELAVFIPVEVSYGFGKVTANVKVKVTKKGSGLGTPFDDL